MGRKRYIDVNKPSVFLNPFKPKNGLQEHYISTMQESTITFGLGPAGTGKTYLAVYIALEALLNKEVERVVLTRPIVATEDIGFLPGDMHEKINPYIRPLFDAIEDHVGQTKAKELLALGSIEVVPLAFMRGRSLNRAFIVLDEAQNTTPEQMKMFLTRIGYDSKMVINGDKTQCDLNPRDVPVNGLAWASDRLTGKSEQISVVEFSSRHIVRNPLIEDMLQHLETPPAREERPRRRYSEAGGALPATGGVLLTAA